ncbi:hypothetical protein [Streptomyces sp. NPDC051079]|uniref:hypothetical protein n=1 Tax=Streptomyces sp. NPDC051079 TaxID=3155043 RepID=UPI00344C9A5C
MDPQQSPQGPPSTRESAQEPARGPRVERVRLAIGVTIGSLLSAVGRGAVRTD